MSVQPWSLRNTHSHTAVQRHRQKATDGGGGHTASGEEALPAKVNKIGTFMKGRSTESELYDTRIDLIHDTPPWSGAAVFTRPHLTLQDPMNSAPVPRLRPPPRSLAQRHKI
ncbi:unnamed protein product [Pleuronectes platessa]|uniref:Uncharacterized protein n=1 Tax=Pleuronectes platessa TaxID=8262 RepID=A0A9N7VZN2_PLEPL|nr:unnamed protein product [Pleuronectes platessa]